MDYLIFFTVFEKATRELGGQKYPTFVSGFAYLRGIHNHLSISWVKKGRPQNIMI